LKITAYTIPSPSGTDPHFGLFFNPSIHMIQTLLILESNTPATYLDTG